MTGMRSWMDATSAFAAVVRIVQMQSLACGFLHQKVASHCSRQAILRDGRRRNIGMQPFAEIGNYYDLLYASKDYGGEADYSEMIRVFEDATGVEVRAGS